MRVDATSRKPQTTFERVRAALLARSLRTTARALPIGVTAACYQIHASLDRDDHGSVANGGIGPEVRFYGREQIPGHLWDGDFYGWPRAAGA